MFKILISFVIAMLGFQAYAVNGDFSGEARFRLGVQNDNNELGSILSKAAVGDKLNHEFRSVLSGSFRANESLVGNVDVYTNISAAPGRSGLMFAPYGDWMISDELMLRAGVSSYEIADGSVIGMNDYNPVPTLLQGLFFTHSSEFFGADLVVARRGLLSVPSETDALRETLGILSLDVRSLPDVVKQANVHLIAPVNVDFDVVRAGLTLGGGMMGVSYRVTVAHDNLVDFNSEGSYMLEGKLGYAYDMGSSTVKVYGGYHHEGSSYDPFLYDVHKNAGMLDTLKWGNGLAYAKAGLAYWVDSDLGFGVVGHYVTQAGESVSQSQEAASAVVADKGTIEVDAYVKANVDSSVSLALWGGVLKTSASTYDLKTEASVRMRF